jgi:hypothetical protein
MLDDDRQMLTLYQAVLGSTFPEEAIAVIKDPATREAISQMIRKGNESGRVLPEIRNPLQSKVTQPIVDPKKKRLKFDPATGTLK